jgi:hypothetical protein
LPWRSPGPCLVRPLKPTAVRALDLAGGAAGRDSPRACPRVPARFAALRLLTAFRRLAALQTRRRQTDKGTRAQSGNYSAQAVFKVVPRRTGAECGMGLWRGRGAPAQPATAGGTMRPPPTRLPRPSRGKPLATITVTATPTAGKSSRRVEQHPGTSRCIRSCRWSSLIWPGATRPLAASSP